MRSDISFVAGLTLLFISNVESQAYGKPEPDNHHHFDARQAVAPTSSSPDATAGVAAAVSASNVAQASAVASICDAASNRNQKMWVANNMGMYCSEQIFPTRYQVSDHRACFGSEESFIPKQCPIVRGSCFEDRTLTMRS